MSRYILNRLFITLCMSATRIKLSLITYMSVQLRDCARTSSLCANLTLTLKAGSRATIITGHRRLEPLLSRRYRRRAVTVTVTDNLTVMVRTEAGPPHSPLQ